MYLKSLFIHGFKSFPSSVTLEFNKGITSVVGPNGSGKSNISDAIRWVLGEQSAKNLRGGKMEDVIFFGTANRKSVGYCEVSMVLDNSDRLMSLDFDEIKITRRQTRSGESSYSINGVTSRLKDVLELFMDTGIGKEGYSIIGQGRIEEILKSKSDERRLLFEEATGIVKYKKRRTDANNKLAKQKENLVRINDILKELEVQVGPLKKQSEKAKEYLHLYEIRKTHQIALFLIDVTEKEEIEKKYLQSIADYKINIDEKQKDYDLKETTIATLKIEHQELTDSIKTLQNNLALGKEEHLNLSHTISMYEEKINSIKENINRLNSETNYKKSELSAQNLELEANKIDLTNSEDIIKNLKQSLLDEENNLKKLQDELGLNDSALKNLNTKLLENAESIAGLTSKINNEIDAYDNLNNDTENNIEGIKLLKDDIAKLDLTVTTLNKLITSIESEIADLKESIKIFEENVKTTKEKQVELSNEKSKILSVFHEQNAKFKALDDARRSHLGYYDSVKFVLNRLDEKDKRFEGVLGTVGDIFTTKKEYELALETTLASQIQNIVTDNENTAKNIINILRDEHKGRATFLPLTTVKTFGDSDTKMLSEKGVIGFFSDLVNYDAIFSPIAKSLLQKTLLIDNIDNAILFNKKYKNKIKIVTLSGDILSTTGSMTGGSHKKNQSSIFSNKRLLEEIEEKVTTLKQELETIEYKINQTDEKSENLSKELSIARTLFTEKQEELQESKSQLSTAMLTLKFKNDELAKANDYDTTILNQIESKNLEIKELYANLNTLKELRISLQEELQNFTNNSNIDKDKKDKQQSYLMELNISLSKENEKKTNLTQNIIRIENLIKSTNDDIKNLHNNVVTENQSLLDLDIKIKETIENKNILFANNEVIEKNIASRENILNEKLKNHELLTNTNKELFIEISELSKALSKDELYLSNVSDQISKLYDEIWNEYELTYQMCLEYKKIELPHAEIKQIFQDSSRQIKQLGSINIDSIEQYDEVSTRYEFLTAQKEDIVEGEKKLDLIIKDLTELMEEQFKEQFLVIRENFKEVFQSMFGGGQADLVLTEPDDPLNSPIEILAEPPGKKLKNLMLMSGGEKSLTAICLLFGILKMKPSPFCVLDEIEAALDDANVDRYAKFLSEFKNETQFILITHRKGTMVIADTLYGVTMEEMGISKLVSVKLEEYEEI